MTGLPDVPPRSVVIRLPSMLLAGILFVLPVLTAPVRAVAVVGAIGLLLAAVGLAGFWRWPITAAACVFVSQYATALWMRGAPPGIVGAVAFGLALLFLLQSAERGRCARQATVPAGVVRAQIAQGTSFGALALAATTLVAVLADVVGSIVPFAAAPFVAAAGALGAALVLVAAMMGALRRGTGGSSAV
jgi:hypothetical protein